MACYPYSLGPPLLLPPPNPHPSEPTQQDWESWPTDRIGPFVSDIRMQEAMHCFQSFNRQRTDWSRTEEKVFYITEFSRSGRGQFPRLSQIDLNKLFRPELFVGHVTEPQLADLLKVNIEFLWLFISHLLPGVTSSLLPGVASSLLQGHTSSLLPRDTSSLLQGDTS